MSTKRLSNLLVRKYVKPRMKAEQFLQGGGGRDGGILILEASASLLLQCYFQKFTVTAEQGKGGSWCLGLQT
jgi:hypothetical protein